MSLATFNKLSLSVPLPSNFEPWTPLGHMFGVKWRPVVPESFYPLGTVAIGTDISGKLMLPILQSRTTLGFIGIAGAMEALRSVYESPSTNEIKLTRESIVGTFTPIMGKPQIFYYGKSPRLGFQIGNQFKHQSYIGVTSFGSYDLGWRSFETISNIEYASNCRLKRLYLDHGKIIDSSIYDGNKRFIKLHTKNSGASSYFKLSGNLYVWTIIEKKSSEGIVTKEYTKLTIDLTKSTLTINGDLLIQETELTKNIKSGDFFQLEKPWVLEDPALLFEYGLNKDNGFYQTDEQKIHPESPLKITIQGIWFEKEVERIDPTDGSKVKIKLWHVYSDLSAMQFILPTTYDQEKMVLESKDKGGSLADGISLLMDDVTSESIRISIFGSGSSTQNFASDCLMGEFIKINESYFEISGHPRNETVIVNTKASNSFETIFEVMNFENASSSTDLTSISVFQQNFWFINELYYSYPLETGIGLWQGSILEIASQKKSDSTFSTSITIKTNDVKSTKILDSHEKKSTSCKYLTQRFYKNISFDSDKNGAICDKYYKKFDDWYFYNTSQKKTCKILDISFTSLSSDTALNRSSLQINVSLDGDQTKDLKRGSLGYFFVGEPFQTRSGWHGEMSSFVEIAPIFNGREWRAELYGNYYAGTYILPQKTNSIVYVTSFSYGQQLGEITDPSGQRDIPSIQMSAISKSSLCLGSCTQKIGAGIREYVFFLDTDEKILVYRQGDYGWKRELQQKIVVAGSPSEKNGADIGLMKKENIYIVEMTYEAEGASEIYWFVRPVKDVLNTISKFGLSSYESHYVSVDSDVDTNLTRTYGISNVKSVNYLYMPYDFSSYSQTKIVKDANGKDKATVVNLVTADTYFHSLALESGECVEKVYNAGDNFKNKLTSFVTNGQPIRGESQISKVKSFKYVLPTNTVKNIDYIYAHSLKNSSIFLFYNAKPAGFNFGGGFGATSTNLSAPSVFVLRSNTSSMYFHSPTVLEKDEKYGAVPLMILYDFDLRGVVINAEETRAYLFGFTYPKGKSPYDGYEKYSEELWLAMYSFNLIDFFDKGWIFDAFEQNFAQNGNMFISRFPTLVNQEPLPETPPDKRMSDNIYGTVRTSFGHQVYEYEEIDQVLEDQQYSQDATQNFVSILDQKDFRFSSGPISISNSGDGELKIFIQINEVGLVCLISKNDGVSWSALKDGNNKLIIYGDASETNPYVMGDLLFLIKNSTKQLIVKNMNDMSETVIANDIIASNISGSMQETGIIYVYYYGSSGNVAASKSYDVGKTWEKVNNW